MFYCPTKEGFALRHLAHVRDNYAWANDPDPTKLNRFMANVVATIRSEGATWDFTGPLVAKTWKDLGFAGKPTLKGLRALPDGADTSKHTVTLRANAYAEREMFVAWLEANGHTVPAEASTTGFDQVDGIDVEVCPSPGNTVAALKGYVLDRLLHHWYASRTDTVPA